MTKESVKEWVEIEGIRYDCIYQSGITGKRATWQDLVTGRFDSARPLDQKDKGHITPDNILLIAFRKRTKIKQKLIINDWNKPRCPRCFWAQIEEYANKRIRYSLGNNYPTASAKVDYGSTRTVRYQETSRYCECCNTTYVKKEMVVDEY